MGSNPIGATRPNYYGPGNLLTMGHIKEAPFTAVITDIKHAASLGAKGNNPVAIVQSAEGVGWYPLLPDHQFTLGDNVMVTPQTSYHPSGGSLTVYRIELIPE